MGVAMQGGDKTGRRYDCNDKPGWGFWYVRAGVLVLALGMLAGCAEDREGPGVVGAVAEADPPDDLRRRPCEVVTRDMVSTAFALDAEAIEQSSMSSLCAYRWESGGELLDVTVHVSAVAADAAQARALFETATSGEGAKRPAAGSKGHFEDIDGLGDQARIDTGNGDVHVRSDRVYFTLNAYHGPAMPPVTPSPTAVSAVDARARWWQATLPQRRQATEKLARVSVDPADVD